MSNIRMTAIAVLAGLTMLSQARAVEVSLEENKVSKGSVGFVDMKLLFKLFPETQKAKESFEEAVHQTEEQINLRRAEIIGIQSEIARLKAERDLAAKNSSAPLVHLTPTAGDGPAAKPSAPPVAPPNIPGMEMTVSTAVPAHTPVSPGGTGTTVAVSTAATHGGAASPSPTSASPAAAHIVELDREIDQQSKLFESKESEFKAFESQAEKSLLDLESRKSEVLLGRIYAAIRDVAKAEDISVVVDKSQILFGHKAVDLTDKVVKKLKSESQ